MMEDLRQQCIFCRIADHDIPAKIAYEDQEVIAFHDLAPRAPVHVLIIPKKHIPSLAEAAPEDEPVLGRIQVAARKIAEQLGLAENGFRLVSNCRADGGQEVPHLHYHLIGGQFLGPYTDETYFQTHS